MSRAETATPERLEAYAQEVERRANAALAALGPAIPGEVDGVADGVIADIVPDDWEWADATAIGGPRRIVITQYTRL